jgi:hypothetical protein
MDLFKLRKEPGSTFWKVEYESGDSGESQDGKDTNDAGRYQVHRVFLVIAYEDQSANKKGGWHCKFCSAAALVLRVIEANRHVTEVLREYSRISVCHVFRSGIQGWNHCIDPPKGRKPKARRETSAAKYT